MNKFLLILFIISINNVYSKINFNTNKVPIEFQYLVEHLDMNVKDLNNIIENIKIINSDLSALPKETTLFLLKFEVYKEVLNFNQQKDSNTIFLNTVYLDKVESKLKTNKAAYSRFGQWLIKSIVADYQPFREDEFINNLEAASKGSSTARKRYREFKQVHKFNNFWLDRFEKLSTIKFNSLISELSKRTIVNLATKSYLFSKQYKNLGTLKSENLFILPVTIKETSEEEVKPEKKENKSTAKELMEKISPEDLSSVSDEIDDIDIDSDDVDDTWSPSPE